MSGRREVGAAAPALFAFEVHSNDPDFSRFPPLGWVNPIA